MAKPRVEKINQIILPAAFIGLLIIWIILTYRHYGITWDEGSFLSSGHQYTREILNALHIPNNLTGNIPGNWIEHFLSHGVFFDVLITFLSLLTKNFNYETYHLFKALLAVPAFIFLYLIVLRLTKKPALAFVSMILLFLYPRFSGDIFNNGIDVPSAMMLAVTTFFFISYLLDKQPFILLLLLSLTLAITINQRVIFWYVFLLDVFILSLFIWLENRRLAYLGQQLFLFSLLTLIFLHLTHPYLFAHPITGIFATFAPSKSFPFHAANLFDGQYIAANALPWYYIGKLITITSPISILILFIIGNCFLILKTVSKHVAGKQKLLYIYILLLFYSPLIIALIIKPILYDGWRHFLFLTIPLLIIAVYGLQAVFKIKLTMLKYILFLLVAVDLGLTACEIKQLYPYQYIYYNQLVGGLPGAYGRYETDYWGAAFKEATLWFNQHLNDPKKTYTIYTEGWQQSSTEYFKPNMIFTYDFPSADYVFTFTRWNADKKHTGKIVYTVQRKGVPLVYIKEGQKK